MLTTDTLDPNEACWGGKEFNKIVEVGQAREWHRVQSIYVVRGNALAEWSKDLGSAFLWEKTPIQGIYATGEVSVAEMQHELEKGRNDDTAYKLREEVRAESTLIADFLQEKEENWERIDNRSVFGPYRTKQRNGFSKSAAQRK